VLVEHKEDLRRKSSSATTPAKWWRIIRFPPARTSSWPSSKIVAGTLMARRRARLPRQGHYRRSARVAELFEARRRRMRRKFPRLTVWWTLGRACAANVAWSSKTRRPRWRRNTSSHWQALIVFKGDMVKKGQQLTEGPWTRTKFLKSAARRNCRNISSAKCRRFTACKCDDQRQAH